jgi:hypothetical protein
MFPDRPYLLQHEKRTASTAHSFNPHTARERHIAPRLPVRRCLATLYREGSTRREQPEGTQGTGANSPPAIHGRGIVDTIENGEKVRFFSVASAFSFSPRLWYIHTRRLLKANPAKAGDAKLLAYVPPWRDRVAGLPAHRAPPGAVLWHGLKRRAYAS